MSWLPLYPRCISGSSSARSGAEKSTGSRDAIEGEPLHKEGLSSFCVWFAGRLLTREAVLATALNAEEAGLRPTNDVRLAQPDQRKVAVNTRGEL